MRYLVLAATVGAALTIGCSSDVVDSTSSSPVEGLVAVRHDDGADGAVKAMADNVPPTAVFQTTPPDSDGRVMGGGPLEVTFNLCRSRDDDAGDDLKYTYDFDNDGAIDSFGHCRASHVYRQPATARVCVSDRQPFDGHVLCREYDVTPTSERLCGAGGPGVVNETLTVAQPTSKSPSPISPVYAIITNFTGYTGPFPYMTGSFRVSESGSYTGNLSSPSVANGFYILRNTFSPSTGTPSTPLSDFMIFSQQLTNTTISNISLEADRLYSYLLVFSTGNSPVTFTLSGPGGVCFN